MNIEAHKIGDDNDFLIWRQGSGNTVEIFDLQVNSARRQGIGRKLVYELLDHQIPVSIEKVWAITRASNRVAQQFYEELRFRSIPLYDFYESKGTVDAIMYVRDVSSLA